MAAVLVRWSRQGKKATVHRKVANVTHESHDYDGDMNSGAVLAEGALDEMQNSGSQVDKPKIKDNMMKAMGAQAQYAFRVNVQAREPPVCVPSTSLCYYLRYELLLRPGGSHHLEIFADKPQQGMRAGMA